MNEVMRSDLITLLLNIADEEKLRANDAWGFGFAEGLRQAARIIKGYEAKG